MAKILTLLVLLMTAVTGAWAQGSDPDPIELTSTDGETWTLTEMPAYDVELEVEYYNEVTLTDGNAITGLNDYKEQEIWVNYTRSFTAGTTSTVCLPFAYTKKAGDGSFYAFTNIEKVGSEYVATMTEPAATTLTANTPYLYMPNATGNVDFGGAYTIPATLTAGSTTSNGWTFCGTYTSLTYPNAAFDSDYVYGFAGAAQDASGDQDAVVAGEFVRAGNGSTFPVMRCYLKRDSELQAIGHRAAAMPDRIVVRLHDADGHVTSIGGQLTVKDENAQCYTLDGRLVNGQPTQKGIYVKNGKKVVIK